MKHQDNQCIDGRCPVGIDAVKKIGLTPKEKRAIFFTIKREIRELKKTYVVSSS